MEEIKLEREISSLEKSFERAKTKRTNIEEYFDTKMTKLNNNLQEMEADLKKMIDKDHVEVSPRLYRCLRWYMLVTTLTVANS